MNRAEKINPHESYSNEIIKEIMKVQDYPGFVKNLQEKYVKEIINNNIDIKKLGSEYLKLKNTPISDELIVDLYDKYLKNIFPDSMHKDILYHETNTEEEFESFDIEKASVIADFGKAFYFSPEKETASGMITDKGERGMFVKINIKNPFQYPEDKDNINFDEYRCSNDYIRKNNYDSVIDYDYWLKERYRRNKYEIINQIAVFDNKNIHILGSKDDVVGFRKYLKL